MHASHRPGSAVVGALLCWLPFPDFGVNRDVVQELKFNSSCSQCQQLKTEVH